MSVWKASAMSRWTVVAGVCLFSAATCFGAAKAEPKRSSLDPRGRVHIPIGIANTVDTLKTFVEAEGNFSPGFATYGIYFWVYDHDAKKLIAPTMDGVKCEHGLPPEGYLIPWSAWTAAGLTVKTEVCQVRLTSPAGEAFVVAARAHLTNAGTSDRKASLYVALRPLGPAGGPVRRLAASDTGDALLADGHPALVAESKPSGAGVLATDTITDLAAEGQLPAETSAESTSGDCSGALRFDLAIPAGKTQTLGFICPVLPGRRAVGHQWDGTSGWAQFDLAKPNPAEGGVLQPDPGLDYYRALNADTLFQEAEAYWKDLAGRFTVQVPDARWSEALAAILGHAAMCMNEGAPDVAVVNYNVFNRDGAYAANIFQKSGNFELAEAAIDYFLDHPFNGRVRVEADNPGQVLWTMGEHWLLSRDKAWLRRVYSGARRLARMIEYYRTRPAPHYVKARSLKFGDGLPPDAPDEKPAHQRQVLRPGSCDGHHPEYTEAFDIAGLWRAAMMARARGEDDDAGDFAALADEFTAVYDARFGQNLAKGYGSYAVLWPCRLYPFGEGKAHQQFRGVGAQKPGGWRYFPLARAHQGLLAGNREAGHATIDRHLDHEQMRGWYAFDEGGKSGSGGWGHARTTWTSSVAMPHGWAIAELWHLLRDSLLVEDGDRLVLLAGVPPEWFTGGETMAVANMPTYFGPCSFEWKPSDGGATLALTGTAAPAQGFVLRLPEPLQAAVTVDGKRLKAARGGEVVLPLGTKQARIQFQGNAAGGAP
ncbi:MAG: hypothetical protein AMS14_10325 [Planctomycetes bacterium DG_20]|nr:MAG: hypothetical protein AMS14_10325 [Planctomycetes bacterium DG_20]